MIGDKVRCATRRTAFAAKGVEGYIFADRRERAAPAVRSVQDGFADVGPSKRGEY